MTEPNNQQPAIRVVMMPRDTNPMGTIFGGIILSYIDQAGAVEFRKHSDKKLVTVAMHEVKFLAPVLVGDLVSLRFDYIPPKTENMGFLRVFRV